MQALTFSYVNFALSHLAPSAVVFQGRPSSQHMAWPATVQYSPPSLATLGMHAQAAGPQIHAHQRCECLVCHHLQAQVLQVLRHVYDRQKLRR